MKLRCIVTTLTPLLVCCCWAQSDPVKDYVATPTDAYFILPPELVCGPTITRMEWSQDGERLAVLRSFQKLTAQQLSSAYTDRDPATPDEPEDQLFTWNSKTDKTSMLFKLKVSEGSIQNVSWVAGSSSLVVEAQINSDSSDLVSTTFLVSATGQVKKVFSLNSGDYAQAIPSPTKPSVAFVVYPAIKTNGTGAIGVVNPPIVRFFGVDGVPSGPVTFPSRRCQLRWSLNGQVYVVDYTPVKGATTRKQQWYVVNRNSMSLEATTPPQDLLTAAPQATPLMVKDLTAKMAINKVGVLAPTVTLNPTTESGDASFGIVTTDGQKGELAPNLSAVAFVSQGNAMVRPLAKVPLLAYRKAKLAALKTKLLLQAKQVGLAIIMSSGDNDDMYPTNKGNWQAGLLQYLQDPNLCDGFNYTFGGGSATAIESPATTEMGYIDGPGGRAVVYTDGHAKWLPNP